ncbi:MAG: DNA gyrase inhibitor YacG [Pyrinomonadaceae bacterium]
MPKVKCPTCKKETEYTGNEFRPFCSERCKMIDFGDWADGNYRLPDRSTPLSEKDIEQIENSFKENAEL